MGDVQVVDQQQIDAWQAEALQAVLEAPHDPIVAVVETVLEFQSNFSASWKARNSRPTLVDST